jgi:UDP-glucose 4-epimerase
MKVLVTGARGKVGGAVAAALLVAGHEVVATDLARPTFERQAPDEPAYRQADLTDAGHADAVVRGADALVHAAAIPDPLHNPPSVVFGNNLMATFNVLEAAVRSGARRFVNASSETVPGYFFPERPFLPTISRSTRSTPSGRRTPTRSPSTSASSSWTRRCAAPT